MKQIQENPYYQHFIGLESFQHRGTSAKAMAALASGAVSGSGIANGTHMPGSAIVATIGGVMGATASLVNFFFGD